MTTLPAPRIPDVSELALDAVAAEAARLDNIAAALLRFANDFADRSVPFAVRAAEYRLAAAKLRAEATR